MIRNTFLRTFGFLQFIRHWGALVTGGVIVAAVWLGNSVLGWQIPWIVNFWLATLFLGVAVFKAWREDYLRVKTLDAAPLRPIEIRNRLDEQLAKGRQLLQALMEGEKVSSRDVELWEQSVRKFVERHFTVQQNDAFKEHITKLGIIFEVALALPNDTRPEANKSAQLIAKRIGGLEKLRPDIRD